MALIIVKIEKEDVSTFQVGINVGIRLKNNIEIVFSREALEELLSDYSEIVHTEMNMKDEHQCGCGHPDKNCECK